MTFQPPPPPPQGPPPQGPPPGPPPQGPTPSGQPGYGQPAYGQPAYGQPPQAPQPQGPPPGQWGPPPGQPMRSGGGTSFDPKSVNSLDWGILGAGVLAFIFSFVSYYSYSGKGAFASQYSVTTSAWSGFFGWFAMLLALIGSAVVALEIFMSHVKLPVPNRLIGLGAYALATLCVILAIFIVPDYLGGGPGYDNAVDEGHGFGFWISLIVIVAGLVLSFLRFQQTGGQFPIGGGTGRPGGAHGNPGGPPPSSYGPPQNPQGPPQGPPPGPPPH